MDWAVERCVISSTEQGFLEGWLLITLHRQIVEMPDTAPLSTDLGITIQKNGVTEFHYLPPLGETDHKSVKTTICLCQPQVVLEWKENFNNVGLAEPQCETPWLKWDATEVTELEERRRITIKSPQTIRNELGSMKYWNRKNSTSVEIGHYGSR